jgi:pyridoxal 5-phosphate dependent beta-lyase
LPDLHSAAWADPVPALRAGIARFEPADVSVAAHVGLAAAVSELLAAGAAELATAAARLGRTARAALDGVGNWRVIEPLDEPTATVTLRHSDLEPAGTWARLHDEHAIVTSWIPLERAPADLDAPVLRASFHPGWITEEDIGRFAAALGDVSRTTPA